MKKTSLTHIIKPAAGLSAIFFFIVLSLSASAAAFYDNEDYVVIQKDGDVTYLNDIRFENRQVVKDGREVTVSMDIILDSTKIKTQHTVTLTPVILSKDKDTVCVLESVIVDGRRRNKVFLRSEALDSVEMSRAEAQAIIKRINGSDQEYFYTATVPYQREMLDGSVKVCECVKGCASCGHGESEAYFGDILPAYVPVWKVDTIAPTPEPVKRRAEEKFARIQFYVDRSDIVPALKNNRAELDTVKKSISLVLEKDYLTISNIEVTGYASPEATYEYNMALSSRRANSFADYIAKENNIDRSKMSVGEGGENWEGFKAALIESDFEEKDAVLAIINRYTHDRNECERVMRSAISPEQYRWLLNTLYPDLRMCVYRIEYEVENFDLEAARRVIHKNPEDMSLQEMLWVAGSYEKYSEEYDYAMETAMTFFPDEPAAVSHHAMDLYEDGDYEGVIDYLEDGDRMGDNPVLTNVYGVACAKTGQYEAAQEAFEKAAGQGDATAADNLIELLNVIDQL